MKRRLATVALLGTLWCEGAVAGEGFSPPKGWMIVPEPDADRLYRAGNSREEWAVSLKDGRVAISPRAAHSQRLPAALAGSAGLPLTRSPYRVLPVEGGYFVGGNAGEWGGGLAWLSLDGRAWTVLHRDPVSALLLIQKDTVLSFEGLGHLGEDHGTARWLTRDASGRWVSTQTTSLEECPLAVVAGVDEVYIAGARWLTTYSFDGWVKEVQALRVGKLMPNSMVREADGTLWLGARQFVVRLEPVGSTGLFTITWLARRERRAATLRGEECICSP